MKSFIYFLSVILLLCVAGNTFAQSKKTTFKVAGECGMCQKNIEKAAKSAGASFASWNVDSKMLTLRYNAATTNTAKIEQSIAAAGYDTPHVTATEAAYKKLHACCQYQRAASSTSASCCASAKCVEAACMKDGKCVPDMSCCKDSGCSEKACCKKS